MDIKFGSRLGLLIKNYHIDISRALGKFLPFQRYLDREYYSSPQELSEVDFLKICEFLENEQWPYKVEVSYST